MPTSPHARVLDQHATQPRRVSGALILDEGEPGCWKVGKTYFNLEELLEDRQWVGRG